MSTVRPDGPRPNSDAARAFRHELRTPLNHIIGYADLLIEEAEARRSGAAADVRRILVAGQDLLGLIDDLMSADRAMLGPLDTEILNQRIRAQLNAVLGYAELLDEEAASDDGAWLRPDLDRVAEAARRLLGLLTPVLDAPPGDPGGTTKPAPAEPGAIDGPTVGGRRATPQGPGSILVVDDDPSSRDILVRRLTRLGHGVAVAADGRQALALIRACPLDLILLDVRMPELDGIEVLRELKADSALSELPVIMLSAGSETEEAARCLDLGADDYLPKPFNPSVLHARVEACIERKRLRERELEYLRRTAQVTGPAAIADLLYRVHGVASDDAESAEVRSAELSEGEQALLADLNAELAWIHLGKGEALVRQGDPSDAVFVLVYGRLTVIEDRASEGPRVVGEIQRGETIGEWSLLSHEPQRTTVKATRDSIVARISRESFGRLTRGHARTLTNATRDVIGRMQQAYHARPGASATTAVALLPLDPGVRAADFARALAAELRPYGSTLHLSRGRLADELGEAHARLLAEVTDDRWAVGRLNDLELRHRFVLYEADADLTPWTRRCLRQADRVLLVGRAEAMPRTSSLEDALAEAAFAIPEVTCELVLLHETRRRVAVGTRDWVAGRSVTAHHHIGLQASADLRRLARRLAGQAVGLVLGGGGVRGAAHLGVLKALEEAKIPIDVLGGTSAGSYVAGLYALGGSPDELHVLTRDLFVAEKPFGDYTVPIVALLSGGRLGKTFQKTLGDVQIEDLWLPFFCVGSNLTRAEIVVYRQGSLWRAVRASCSIPGVLPPVVDQGDLVVDGGVLNNLPTDIMAAFCGGGPVIASDLRVKVEMGENYRYGEAVSGPGLLWNRWRPFRRERPKAPSITSVVLRASLLGSVHAGVEQARRATFYVNPPVGRFPLLDVYQADALFELGYKEAVSRIAEWQRAGDFPGARPAPPTPAPTAAALAAWH